MDLKIQTSFMSIYRIRIAQMFDGSENSDKFIQRETMEWIPIVVGY